MAKNSRGKRPCCICRKWFQPDVRQKGRQKTCGAPDCMDERHRRQCEKWNKKNKAQWQELVRSCGDVFVVSKSLIPRPIEPSVTMLNKLPEKPTTIILDDRESSEEHANRTSLPWPTIS